MKPSDTTPIKRMHILALSKALGNPTTVGAIEGDTVEDCLVEMAAKKLAAHAPIEAVDAGQNVMPHGVVHLLPPVTMSVGQLRYAIDGMGGGDNKARLSFQWKLLGKDTDGAPAPAGLYCWQHAAKDEGMLHLPAGVDPKPLEKPQPAIAADLIITLRQAEKLVAFFGGHDTEVSIARHEKGLLAWCTDYPGEGGQYLGDTEVDDELADKGRPITFDLVAHLTRQQAFSARTFGPGMRTQGVVDHIRKELIEVLAKPEDLSEWIDVAILALDGAWRTGATPEQIITALVAKQTKNEGRQWPDWHTMPVDQAIEHVRTVDAPELAGPQYPAAFLVNTVNGPTYACMQHTRALGAVFGLLGAGTLPMPLDDDDQHECENCINEATTRGAA